MAYDMKCFQLAEAFLEDDWEMCREENHTGPLAQVIQNAIEEYLNEARLNWQQRKVNR